MVDRADVAGIAVPTGHLIANQWVASAETFETRSPLEWGGPDDPALAQVARGDSATVPTLGPSGRQDLLNCWEKNRL